MTNGSPGQLRGGPLWYYFVELVAVLLDGITVRYTAEPVINALTLRIEDGEALALLGPSGSGKTTVLRAIAGFERPESGHVMFDGRRMNQVPPAERNVAMVFQENVLFPHLDVRGNVGFPLSIRRRPAAEIANRVEAETRAAGIANLLTRNPDQLSAGQQQIAQLARAMVRRPDLLLVDEPMARLDHIGGERLRAELRMVQTGYGVTALYATHSYSDAMALADRVAIIDEGSIRQVGSPTQIYEEPTDVFVASFVGDPPMSVLSAELSPGGVSLGHLYLSAPVSLPASVMVGVRPEEWSPGERGLEARVTRGYSLGPDFYADVETSAGTATVRSQEGPLTPDTDIHLRPGRYHLFDASTGEAVYHSET